MHLSILVPGLILLTASMVTAFGVFFFANQATGRLKTFGNAVGVWVLVMGALAIVMAVIGAFSPHHMKGRHHRGDWRAVSTAPPSVLPDSVAPVQ